MIIKNLLTNSTTIQSFKLYSGNWMGVYRVLYTERIEKTIKPIHLSLKLKKFFAGYYTGNSLAIALSKQMAAS
jgi:hypothetical protein